MITFLNAAMLMGLAAIAVPILIHLLNKRRFKTVPWGAMMFLKASMAKVSRRLRMENFLLLLVRILIITLLALAFARPAITTSFTLLAGGGRVKTAMVILIDNSLSMQYKRGEKTNLDHAKKIAAELIGTLKKGDTVSVFTITDETIPVVDNPAFEFQRVKDGVEKIQPTFRRADYMHAVDVAVKHLQDLKNPVKQVFIVTDLQATGWATHRPDDWKLIVEPLNNTKTFPSKPQFNVIDISEGERENAAILNTNYFPRVFGPMREVRIDVQIMNFGRQDRETFLTPFVNGVEKPNLGKPVRLEPQRAVTESIYVRFDQPGSHGVELSIGGDPLVSDNRRFLALEAIKEVPVLLVNGAPSMQPFKGETDFLDVALSPRVAAQLSADGTALARPQVVDLRGFSSRQLSQYAVIVLANVANLSVEDTRRVEEFVRGGGGLIIFPGDLLDLVFYNGPFFDGGNGLLPTTIGDAQGDDKEKDERKWIRIGGAPYSHPMVQTFSDPSRADLTTANIRKWYRLDPPPADAAAKVVVSLETGTPWLVEKPYGMGRVVLCATPCDADWSNIPVRRFYVPLMHEMVYFLAAGNRANRNVLVGSAIVQSLRSDKIDPGSGIVRLPNGETKPLPFKQENDLWVAAYNDTFEPGIYQIEVKVGDKVEVADFAVNMADDESNLVALDDDQQNMIKTTLSANFTVGPEWKNVAKRVETERFGIEIWRNLAYLLLIFLFLELLVTSRRTTKEEVGKVEGPEAVLTR